MPPFITFLQHRLQQPLPGQAAQLRMAPRPVAGWPKRRLTPSGPASNSSVLILLFSNEQKELEVILTVRSQDIAHGGQISFPGGRSEAGETIAETALREAQEETGVNPEEIQVLGNLSRLYIDVSGHYVTPVVGYAKSRPHMRRNPAEVREIFSIELDSLLIKKNLTVEQWNLRKYAYEVPFWKVHQVPLWGATAMMISEFLELYREFREGSGTAPD